MKEIQQLQKQLTSAKALESRRQREAMSKAGAVEGFDYGQVMRSEGKDAADAELAKREREEIEARKRYYDAAEKRKEIEDRIEKLRPKQRRPANAPLF